MLCSLVLRYQLFLETYCLHLHDRRNKNGANMFHLNVGP
jgi:hypothetical protein